jgi:outer membrane receptor protein involved in Fe transport
MAAHTMARAVADQGRPEAGSAQFRRIFDSVRTLPIPQGGLLVDRSDLWMTEGQYNFSDVIKFADVLVGGNWKQYVLNSEGTVFADTKGNPIKINEYGGYIQISREVIKERLRLTASGRYDKNQNFKGRFTPRFTAVIKPATDHNIRVSYQTAYRFPSTQQQWIDLDVGTGRLIGSNIFLYNKYDLINNPARSAQDPTEVIPYREVKPESVTSYEVGYKALISKRLLLDVYAYRGAYKDFITRRDAIQTQGTTRRGFSLVANSPQEVNTYGWGGSVEYVLVGNFVASGSITSDRTDGLPTGYRAFFNAPILRTVLSLANTGFGRNKRLGANVSWRWQEGLFYENDFTQGDLPGFHTVDAAVNYRLPKLKSMFKVGATNLLNQYYRTALGNPSVGGLYYVSFAYGVL